MSTTLAIADVTSTLVNLLQTKVPYLDSGVVGVNVTALPLDKALDNYTGNQGQGQDQLNVFLYHVVASAFWRNQPMPQQSRRGETAPPPLGLTLHYLLSAWATTDDIRAHRILSAAMAYLHDHPVFNRSDLAMWLPQSDLSQQVERVRITEEPLTVDEMYKLWSAFQTHYRVSAAYQVSVVLIDSSIQAKAPLPVLKVQIPGPSLPEWPPPPATPTHFVDTGVQASVNIPPLAPTLTSLTPYYPRPFSLYGETLTINGLQLVDASATSVQAILTHTSLSTTVTLSAAVSSSIAATITLSDTVTTLPAGNYTLALKYTYPNDSNGVPTKQPFFTNELPFTLAPTITTYPPALVALAPPGTGSAALQVQVRPDILPNQRVVLLVGDQLVSPTGTPAPPTDTVNFSARVPPGSYCIRIRVDGADSPIVLPNTNPPALDTGTVIEIGP